MLKKILIAALWLPLTALAQTYPSPTFQNLTLTGTLTSTGGVSLSSLASQAANTVVANVSGSAASPTAVVMPTCNTSSSTLQYTGGTGWGCGTVAIAGANSNITSLTGLTGLITQYNGVGTVANGIPSEYAQANATAQTASITPSTLYATPASGAGLYLVIVDTVCTTAGTAGTVSASIGWYNGSASASTATGPMSLSTIGSETTQIFTIYSAAIQNITYSTTVSGAAGSPQYSIRIRLVYLG
jgi:hypothetical protein